jgi:hypothetical protein
MLVTDCSVENTYAPYAMQRNQCMLPYVMHTMLGNYATVGSMGMHILTMHAFHSSYPHSVRIVFQTHYI